MNKSIALTLAFFTLVFTVYAQPVTQDDAKLMAKAWVAREGMLGARIGRSVEKIATLSTTNGVSFYAVKMAGAGTIFTSSDTDYAPVIAFTSSTNDYSIIDKKSPLWALLNRDVSALNSASKSGARVYAATGSTSSAPSLTQAQRLWNDLISEAKALENSARKGLAYANPITSGNPGDLRVPALVKTKWSQGSSRNMACYNYYTPNGPDPEEFVAGDSQNAPCGCVATAMAQIMRYHKYPTKSLPQITRTCYWQDIDDEGSQEIAMDLTTQGGLYDWDKMFEMPGMQMLSEEEYQAIGKLTSDAGISVSMSYSPAGSGAYIYDMTKAMKDYWGYASAVYLDLFSNGHYYVSPENIPEVSRKALYTNLDAGLPVFMLVPGHIVIADGYGLNNGYEYVHVNMGWGGQEDYWYNLPKVSDYGQIDSFVFNVMPQSPLSSAVISGRVLDHDGKSIAGAIVKLYKSGSSTLATQVVSSAYGVWGAVVPGGNEYDIHVEYDNARIVGDLSGVQVSSPQIYGTPDVPIVTSVAGIGNSWGNDITIGEPSVRVGTEVFSSLDKAIVAARDMSEPVIEILAPTKLSANVEIDFDCTIKSSDGVDPFLAPIVCERDSALNEETVLVVSNEVRVLLQDVVFKGDNDKKIKVCVKGTAALSGIVGVDEIVCQDESKIEIAGVLENPLVIDYETAKDANEVFGFASCSFDEAQLSSKRLFNKYDDELGGVASESGSLSWGAADVDEVSAIVKLNQDGVVKNFRSLKTLMKFVTNDAEIVVVKNSKLSESVTLSKDVVIRSENFSVITVESGASITLDGGMVISNVVFDCSAASFRSSFITLNSGASLTLGENASLTGGQLIGYTGAVYVNAGATLTMLDGSLISNFTLDTASGGAVSLMGKFDFLGGTISSCKAQSGGAICAIGGAELNVSGSAKAVDNTNTEGKTDNINLWAEDILSLGEDCENVSIGVNKSSANDVDEKFGLAPDLSDREFSQDCVRNDVNGDIVAKVLNGQLVWGERTVPVNPVAYIGDVPYITFDSAVNDAKDGDTITIVTNEPAVYNKDIVIDKHLTLTSQAEDQYGLARRGNASIKIISGGHLTVTNLFIDGGATNTFFGSEFYSSENKPIFWVEGGELVLEKNAAVKYGSDSLYAPGGIAVMEGSSLTMKPGSLVFACTNIVSQAPSAILVQGNNATFNFEGGVVQGCGSSEYGAVAVWTGAKILVSNDASIMDNANDDLHLAETAKLILSGDYTGTMSVKQGDNANKKEFGVADENYSGSDMSSSAARFINAENKSDVGVVVTNDANKILVWVSALVENDEGVMTYETESGEILTLMGELPGSEEPVPEVVEPEMVAFKLVSYDPLGASWSLSITNVVKSCWYTLRGGERPVTNEFTVIERKCASDSGEMIFNHSTSSPSFFWQVVAEPSDAYTNE